MLRTINGNNLWFCFFQQSRHSPLLFSVCSVSFVFQNPLFFGFLAIKSFQPQRIPGAALHREIELNWQGWF